MIINTFLLLMSIFGTLNLNGQVPNWQWSKSVGGIIAEGGECVTVDEIGNVYAVGYFATSSVTIDATVLTNGTTGASMLLIKYDPSGNVIWAKNAGELRNNIATSVIVDNNDNVFVAGYFTGQTLTFGSTVLTNAGSLNEAIFIVKYDVSGNILWAKTALGSGVLDDHVNSMAVDSSGNIYVVGSFESSTLNFGVTTLTQAGIRDIFIAKYDSTGNFQWAQSAGGDGPDEALSISVDAEGNSFTTGYYGSTSILLGNSTFTNSNNINGLASTDIFLVKYDPNGNPQWAKNDGVVGTAVGQNYGEGVTIDSNGNLFVVGFFTSPSIAFGSNTLTSSGSYNMFIVKYDSIGNPLWARGTNNSSYEEAYSVSVDSYGNAYVTGWFIGTSINFGSNTISGFGDKDIFLVKYDSLGNSLWAESIGGNYEERSYSIAMDANGDGYLTGFFQSAVISFGNTTLTNAGYTDLWIAKFCGISNNCLTGISEENMEPELTIYPNPSNGFFNTQMTEQTNAQIKIFNLLGECVYQNSVSTSNLEIDLGGEVNGVYLMQLNTEQGTLNKKLIIQK